MIAGGGGGNPDPAMKAAYRAKPGGESVSLGGGTAGEGSSWAPCFMSSSLASASSLKGEAKMRREAESSAAEVHNLPHDNRPVFKPDHPHNNQTLKPERKRWGPGNSFPGLTSTPGPELRTALRKLPQRKRIHWRHAKAGLSRPAQPWRDLLPTSLRAKRKVVLQNSQVMEISPACVISSRSSSLKPSSTELSRAREQRQP
jgi:hypothetical protein